ncbi:hypothetical protein V6N12_057531 [Hibiscus sabdariffa]|uniref:Uncharacterized protein n=1 Tax=Hibiscus sabdariffa TaxID=183260 RepID=A0ABR2C612_9ROSI
MEIGGEIFVLSISELGFKDDSVLTLEKRVKKGREDRDIPEDSDSVSDAISSEKGVVVEDRCNSGTEVDVINAMCTERDYDDCFLRENNACGSRGIEEEWMGGNSKDTTAGRGIQSVEEFKDNREESPMSARNGVGLGVDQIRETQRTWADRVKTIGEVPLISTGETIEAQIRVGAENPACGRKNDVNVVVDLSLRACQRM